ncbi:HET-domain-containing protein [Aulographum hederae CBS 113979]|uniref:HET-domain-containing protein n=1 Tax=Aulographum hederae CBS 113979 TaxID=1176131 RepID=A0A6G1GY58_9PEZI|nr:HET-domain-containing protein [Aulographum hederae CBS 113979]
MKQLSGELCSRCRALNLPTVFKGTDEVEKYDCFFLVRTDESGNIEGFFPPCPFCELVKSVFGFEERILPKPKDAAAKAENKPDAADNGSDDEFDADYYHYWHLHGSEFTSDVQPFGACSIRNYVPAPTMSPLRRSRLDTNFGVWRFDFTRIRAGDLSIIRGDEDQEHVHFSRLCIQISHPSGLVGERRLIQLGPDTPPHDTFGSLLFGRPMSEDEADMDLVSTWLSLCDSNIDHICGPNQTEIFDGFRLVDVRSRCIDIKPKSTGYIALSYVWGTSQRFDLQQANLKALQTPGSLSDENAALPLVIRDAMLITEKIGLQYIWIDALCIVQDSPQDKTLQINKMDSIYSGASLTIVAAAGKDATAGLPGARHGQRKLGLPQLIVCFDDMQLIATTQCGDSIPSSVWDTRGWTFQEKMLSRRLLYFCEDQVFYRCTTKRYQEDTILETFDDTLKVVLRASASDLRLAATSPFYYLKCVEDYNSRNFTYEDDILNAFKGIENQIEPTFGHSIWGLPVKLFHLALLWSMGVLQTEDDERRREAFPTWCWAGWRREESHFIRGRRWLGNNDVYDMGMFKLEFQLYPMVQYHRVSPAAEVVSIFVPFADGAGEVSYVNHRKAVDLREELLVEHNVVDPQWVHPAELTAPSPPLSHLLCFITSVAHLGLEKDEKHFANDDEYHIVSQVAGKKIGTIMLGPKVTARHGQSLDFIILASAVYDVDGEWFPKGFHVLAVYWVNGVAYRIEKASGIIEAGDWWEAGAKMRIINLA